MNNLVNPPARNRRRAALHGEMQRIRGTGFMPEPMMVTLAAAP